MRTRRCVGVFVVGGLTFISSSSALTRYVNVSNATPAAPYTNWAKASTAIQPAIDAAASGDGIWVAPGTYLLTGTAVQIPPGKTLTLRSTQSRAAIIDAQLLSQGLVINGNNSWVEGFTIRGGSTVLCGGGIEIGQPATVRDCLVTRNSAAYDGGGIVVYEEATNALVEDCTIVSNFTVGGHGGGVMLDHNSHGRINRCAITDNSATEYGGGVCIKGGSGSVSNCRIARNWAFQYGGGIFMHDENTTNPATVVNCVIDGNTAVRDGGGVDSVGPDGTLSSIVNCTIVSNSAVESGGGVRAFTTRFINNIIYFNSAPTNANLDAHDSLNSCLISNCCTTSNYFWPCITNAPAFVDAGAGDFRLATASFCIDAGTTIGAPQTDIDGNPRPRQGNPSFMAASTTNCDMGAYEYAFHFNSIEAVSTNAVRFRWDVQDKGRYRLDAATHAAADPLHPVWNSVMTYTQVNLIGMGQFAVHTTTVTNPTPPMPSNAIYRLSIDSATPG